MHAIQKFILVQLMTERQLRFNELKPNSMEGSKFTYHLQKLLLEGLVKKSETGYTLTSDGKALAEGFELESLTTTNQPRTVVLIACRHPEKGWLLSKRLTQPSLDMIGFPKISITLGKNLLSNAQKSFSEMTGLTASKLSYQAHGYVTQYNPEGSLESQVYFHLLQAHNVSGTLINNTDTATLFWEIQPNWKDKQMIPSMTALVALLGNPKAQFVELEYYL